MAAIKLIWLVPLLPFLGFLVLGLVGRRLGSGTVRTIACGTILGAFIVSVLAAVPVLGGHLDAGASREGFVVDEAARSVDVSLWEWLPAGERQGACVTATADGGRGPGEPFLSRLSIPLGFLLDPLSAIMILVVTGVGFLIHVYAASYMAHEAGYWRFFTYLNLFVAMMLMLVLGSSFALMFVGWEGVGLCSYLLIGFYYTEVVPPRAGLKAFLVNRVGDFGFLLGMLLLLLTFGSLQYSEVFPRAVGASAYAGSGTAIAVAALLFVGAMGKSAQFPLHVWLPDAMAGPTPVSALIHAATMVTAGVYLVIRGNVLFQAAPAVSVGIAILGVITALVAASIALVQDDLKKVLAYSTVSQLGYMFIAVGVGAYAAGLFHLVTHAFFKALLFLGAGAVSHAMAGELDMRRMGGLARALPQERSVMLVATLAIAGIAPLSGFWSKDEILAGVLTSGLPAPLRWALWAAALAGALMTAFYMFRLYFRTFAGQKRWPDGTHPHASPPAMIVPLWILAGLSAFGGALGLAAWTGMPSLLHAALEPVVHRGALVAARSHLDATAEITFALVAMGVAVAGILLARTWYSGEGDAPARVAQSWAGARRLLRGKWWIDEVLGALVVRPVVTLSRLAAAFDRKGIDLAVESTALGAILSGEAFRGVSSGRVRTHALAVLVGAVGLVAWLLLR